VRKSGNRFLLLLLRLPTVIRLPAVFLLPIVISDLRSVFAVVPLNFRLNGTDGFPHFLERHIKRAAHGVSDVAPYLAEIPGVHEVPDHALYIPGKIF